MVKKGIKISGLFLLILLSETSLFPYLISPLRIDLFIGVIIGMVICLPFTTGGIYTLVLSFFLQAFSGAKLGFMPFAYISSYFGLVALKNIVYLENIISQIILGSVFNILTIGLVRLFISIRFSISLLSIILLGSILTGFTTPAIVYLVKVLCGENEA